MKKIRIERDAFGAFSVGGKLYLETDGEETLMGYTVEPTEAKIPEGNYLVEMKFSQKFKWERPRLKDVPGREAILIHEGNTAADTKGCILVGKERVITEGVTPQNKIAARCELVRSVIALKELMKWIGEDVVEIEVKSKN